MLQTEGVGWWYLIICWTSMLRKAANDPRVQWSKGKHLAILLLSEISFRMIQFNSWLLNFFAIRNSQLKKKKKPKDFFNNQESTTYWQCSLIAVCCWLHPMPANVSVAYYTSITLPYWPLSLFFSKPMVQLHWNISWFYNTLFCVCCSLVFVILILKYSEDMAQNYIGNLASYRMKSELTVSPVCSSTFY